jgi:hypothetical protein
MGPVQRFLVVSVVGGVFCACAALSGVDQFSLGGEAAGTNDGTSPSHVSDASIEVPVDMSSRDTGLSVGEGDSTVPNEGANDAGLDAGLDGSSDAGPQGDAGDGAPGGGDAGGGGADADAGKPVCSSSNCHGCCDSNGNCAGGLSNGTCGTGGENCMNCGSLSCNAGTCSSVAPDAGKCTASSCLSLTLCIPVYQSACCKSDGTCGCNINYPPTQCF